MYDKGPDVKLSPASPLRVGVTRAPSQFGFRAPELYPKEIVQPILQMNAEDWSVHVSEQRPNQAGSLLRQDEFDERIRKGAVVWTFWIIFLTIGMSVQGVVFFWLLQIAHDLLPVISTKSM